ncbi:MAG: PQQ-binding-like beta-propeller repeat protein [Acidobacteriota bacterium]
MEFLRTRAGAKPPALAPLLIVASVASGLLGASPQAAAENTSAGATSSSASVGMNYWPSWRGPLGTGFSPSATPPVTWSETENVRFKVPLPGKGHATPVLWGDRLFLTTAVPVGEPFEPVMAEAPGAHDNAAVSSRHDFVVLAVDRNVGGVTWRSTVRSEVPWQGMHRSGSYASPSPVTDGEVLIASFGTQGVYGLDLAGDVLWRRDFGPMKIKHAHGEGGSPALFGDSAIVQWDHDGPSFLAALDKRTGEDRWRVARDQGTSWSTPIVVEHGGGAQVVVAGTNYLRGHDLKTGRELWRASGLSANVVASPVASEGRVFAGSSYGHQVFFGVELDGASGDVTGTDQVLWSRNRGTPYVPSPLLYGDALYFHNHYQSVLSRVAVDSGADRPGPFRLPGIRNVYGSPVAADGRVYVTDLQGTTLVLSHTDPPQVLARNRLDDRFAASAVLAGDTIFLRGERFLYALADDSKPKPAPQSAAKRKPTPP